ncbi:MAG: hypothetical protein CL489_07955 [Acidobacteria bacterium]|nr:hypothetical protein [Acidobacteriota bacterium]
MNNKIYEVKITELEAKLSNVTSELRTTMAVLDKIAHYISYRNFPGPLGKRSKERTKNLISGLNEFIQPYYDSHMLRRLNISNPNPTKETTNE